jgi:thymidylate synthase (FAD)
MKVRLLTKTEGVEGTEYYQKSIDEIIVGKSRASSSREVNELFDEPHKLLRHCILNQHWCFDKDTEILTSDGFKNIQYVSELNQVACYNKDTDTVSFDYPSHRNKQKYTGEMIGFKNRYIDFLVTPNHRIPIFNKKGQLEVLEAQTIFNNKRRSSNLICFAKETICSIRANPFTNYNKKIMSLIGFFIGDGCVKTSDHGIVFHLTVEKKIEYLKDLCKELNLLLNIQGTNHYVVKSLELKNIFVNLFQTSSGEKTIPRIFTTLETELKDLLLEGLVNSDGHFNKKGSLIYDTTSEDLVDSLQTIFCISGYKINVSKRKRESLNHKERYRLYFSKRQYTTEKKGVQGGWYTREYDDYVYCLSVPTQFLVIRRNNKVSISGNSIFDQAHLGFEITTSRDMGRELLRHSSIHPQEFSQRYAQAVSYEQIELRLQSKSNRQSSTELYISDEQIKDQCTAQGIVQLAVDEAFNDYAALIDAGIAKECARGILPECTTTVLHMEGSIRSWITLLNARLHQTAQKEVRLISAIVRDFFITQCPIIAAALYNFEDAYDIHILERIVLEKYGVYKLIKDNNFKKVKL